MAAVLDHVLPGVGEQTGPCPMGGDRHRPVIARVGEQCRERSIERAEEVLALPHGLRRDPPPRRQTGQRSAAELEAGAGVAGGLTATRDTAQALTANYGKQPDNSDTGLGPTLVVGPHPVAGLPSISGIGRNWPVPSRFQM